MKKIRLTIIIIYVVFVSLITILTIIFVARSFQKGVDLYFKEPTKTDIKLPSPSDIERTIDILRKFKII